MRGLLARALTVGCALALSVATAATAAPGDVERLSVSEVGGDPDWPIEFRSLTISDDGDLVAFASVASNLADPDAVDGTLDVFLRDRGADTTTLGNLASDESKATGLFSGDPALSGDGTALAFYSNGTNLDAGGDSGLFADVFVRDLGTTQTARFSEDSSGSDPDDASASPALSEDGSKVVFATAAPDMFPFAGDAVATSDIVLRDGFINRLVSSIDGTDDVFSNGHSFNPAVSDDVGAVAFESEATNLIGPGADTNGLRDVFVRDVALETTERVSVTDGEAQSDGFSGNADISADGARVVFASSAVLAPGGSPDGRGTYVRDVVAGTTERVDVSLGAVHDDSNEGEFDAPSISDDGRYVAFASDSAELVPNDTNGTTDVFVRDLDENRTIRVSIRSTGAQTNRRSLLGTISGDGSLVAFASEDNGLVPGDTTDPSISQFFEAFAVEPEWTRPETSITAPATTTSTQPAITLGSTEAASTFQCSVDGSAFSQCSSPHTPPPLALGSHTFQARAVDRFGNLDATPASASFTVAPAQQPPQPEYRKTFNAEEVEGQVTVTLPDGTKVDLEGLENIPDGSIVDARRGKVRLYAEAKNGQIQSAVFYGGVFRVTQLPSNILQVALVGPLRASSAAAGVVARVAAAAGAPEALASRRRRRVWGNGKGRFRSKGKYSSATVRGTKWLVEDRRGSTLTRVTQGTVRVRDFVKKRNVTVKKGGRYVARKRGAKKAKGRARKNKRR